MKLKWITLLVILLFSVPSILYARDKSPARSSKKHTHKKISLNSSHQLQQVASFSNKKNAENLARKLRNEGQKAVIRRAVGKDKKTTYRVFLTKKKNAPVASGDSLRREKSWSQRMAGNKSAPERTEVEETQSDTRDVSARPLQPSVDSSPVGETKQVALLRFADSKEDADKLSSRLSKDGYKVTIQEKTGKNGRLVYSLFAQIIAAKPKAVLPPVETTYEAVPEKPSAEIQPAKEMPFSDLKEESDNSLAAQQTAPEPETAVEERPSEAEKAIAGLIAAKESRELSSVQ